MSTWKLSDRPFTDCQDSIGLATCHHQNWNERITIEVTAVLDQKMKACCGWQNHSSSNQKQNSFYKLNVKGFSRQQEDEGNARSVCFNKLLLYTVRIKS